MSELMPMGLLLNMNYNDFQTISITFYNFITLLYRYVYVPFRLQPSKTFVVCIHFCFVCDIDKSLLISKVN